MLTIEDLIAVRVNSSNPSCRHEDRTISSSLAGDAWRVVSEDSSLRWPFLLIICTQHIVTAFPGRVMWDTQTFQHIAKFD